MGGNPNEIHEKRQKFLRQRQSLLERKVKRLQDGLFQMLLNVVLSLDTDEAGMIKNSTRNTGRIAAGVRTAFAAFTGEIKKSEVRIVNGKKRRFVGFGGWVAKVVRELIGMNRIYAESVSNLNLETVEKQALKNYMTRLGWKDGKVVNGSWLDGLAAGNEIKQDVFNRLFQATNTAGGISKSDFIKQFRDDFTGKDRLGFVERRFNMFEQNYLMGIEREISGMYAEKAGMDYFIYSGTKIDTTRDFCRDKVGVLFHKSIFDKWNKMTWAGKIPNAPVQSTQGGYSCRHSFSYTSREMAKRMIERGRKHKLNKEQLEELFPKVDI